MPKYSNKPSKNCLVTGFGVLSRLSRLYITVIYHGEEAFLFSFAIFALPPKSCSHSRKYLSINSLSITCSFLSFSFLSTPSLPPSLLLRQDSPFISFTFTLWLTLHIFFFFFYLSCSKKLGNKIKAL